MTAALGDLLLELLAIPSPTGGEGPLGDWLEARYRDCGERVERHGHSLVVGDVHDPRPAVLLVGHTDVVPPTDDDRVPRRDGARIVGRGASDMKSGLAVAMDCFEDAALRHGAHNVLLVAYAAEEGPAEANELALLLDAVPALSSAALAIVLEPTDLAVQLGCMGGLHAEVAFAGRAAHSARPWHGRNALTAAGPLLAALHVREPEDVEVDGLVFREVLTATQAWTGDGAPGAGRNVVPDRFTVNVNYRFAPDKDVAAAEARFAGVVRGLVAGAPPEAVDVRVVDRAPPGRPRRSDPAVARFVVAADAPVEAKQAWTDVARFSAVGVPALNYGPGLTGQAHQRGEFVPEANLAAARAALARFLAQSAEKE